MQQPEAFLAVANPSAKHNLGTILRCAAAFAVREVVVVGCGRWSTHGAHGSDRHLHYTTFASWAPAVRYLREERGCDICGLTTLPSPQGPRLGSLPGSGVTSEGGPSGGLNGEAQRSDAAAPGAVAYLSEGASGASQTASWPLANAASTFATAATADVPPPAVAPPPPPPPRQGELSDDGTRAAAAAAAAAAAGAAGFPVSWGGAGTRRTRRCPSLPARSRPFRRNTAFLVGWRTTRRKFKGGGEGAVGGKGRDGEGVDVHGVRDGPGGGADGGVQGAASQGRGGGIEEQGGSDDDDDEEEEEEEEEEEALCDFLVHVEQEFRPAQAGRPYSPVSLPATVVTSIALHHFTAWARLAERRLVGEKFDVERPGQLAQLAQLGGDNGASPASGQEGAGALRRAARASERAEGQARDPLAEEGGQPGRGGGGDGNIGNVLGGLFHSTGSDCDY